MSRPLRVTVKIGDALGELNPWVSEIASKLRFDKIVWKDRDKLKEELEREIQRVGDARRVKKYIKEPHNLFTLDKEKNVAYFGAGLLNRVLRLLKERGIAVDLIDLRNKNLMPQPVLANLESLRGKQPEIIALVATSPCGIIQGATGIGKSFIIRQICRMYPGLNILICTKKSSVVRSLYEDLEKSLPGQVGQFGGGKATGAGKRIVVTTTKSIGKVDPREVHLLIVDECHCVGDNNIAEELAKFQFCRRFGFTATPVRGDNTEACMEALFGQILIEVPYEEAAEQGVVTNIGYAMVPLTKGPRYIEDNPAQGKLTSDSFKKTEAYWRNRERNALIRHYADLGLRAGRQVLIMVETLEHAVFLKEVFFRDDDVPVIQYGKGSNDQQFQKLGIKILRRRETAEAVGVWAATRNMKFFTQEERELAAFEYVKSRYTLKKKDMEALTDELSAGRLRCAISTMVLSEGVNLKHLSLLIRADGMVSEVNGSQIPGRLSRLYPGKDLGIMIDFNDCFTFWTKRRSDAREELYKQHKWKNLGHNLEEAIMDNKQGFTQDEP